MYKVKYRISAFLLSVFVVFGTVSSQYLTVQAFDWVAPTVYLPFDGALPYLMGLLGVAPSEDSLFSEEDYKEYLLQNGYSEEDLENESGKYAEWVDDICNGALNQASEYWTKFKEWVTYLSYSSGGTTVINGTVKSIVDTVPDSSELVFSPASIANDTIDTKFCAYSVEDGVLGYIYIYTGVDSVSYTITDSGALRVHLTFLNSQGANYLKRDRSHLTITRYSFSAESTNINFYSSDGTSQYYIYGFSDSATLPSYCHLWNIQETNALNVYNQSLINNLSLALSNALDSAIPDVIPLPWDQIGETANEVTDTIDGLIEQVNTGVISISAYMQAILDLVGAIAVDTTTDLVYPQNPDKPDETIDDKTDANKENQGFTLWGLENVFPFCIPFDIYAFMTLLVAEPVAPIINWPVYNPITQNNEIITIDFSTWNSVVVLFRYIFDFLFIIGMLLMARALIGGGDSA